MLPAPGAGIDHRHRIRQPHAGRHGALLQQAGAVAVQAHLQLQGIALQQAADEDGEQAAGGGGWTWGFSVAGWPLGTWLGCTRLPEGLKAIDGQPL